MNKFLDRDHPFFRPLWARVLTVAVPGAMGVVELIWGGPGWAVVFLAAGGWALWELFLRPKN